MMPRINEKWQELKETIIKLRDNDGTATQQDVCRFLVSLMDVLEKQIDDSDYSIKLIPVSERLPECVVVNNSRCSRDVLIMYDNGEMRVGCFVRDKADGTGHWIAYDNNFPIYFDAIAWMPLSDLYQPEISTWTEGSEDK